MKTTVPLALLSLAGALLPLSAAAIDVSLSAEIRLGRVLPPPPPEVVVVEPVGPKGPPPWAPANGFRRNRDYYYYPDAGVYFRPSDRTWFYLEGSNWRIGTELPTAVRVNFDNSVSLTMETDRPFEQHNAVKQYYPGNYFSKVKVKGRDKGKTPTAESRGNSDSARSSGGDDRGGGKGKGKGKGKN